VRRDELVARLGGDEFVILLTACTLDDALRVADKVRDSVRRIQVRCDGPGLTMGASVGVVPVPPGLAAEADWVATGEALAIRDRDGVAWVLARADQACYVAKNAGRDQVHTDIGADLAA
jgi:GGDEF domain-containing protein